MSKFIFPNCGKANPRCTTTRECALAYNLAPLIRHATRYGKSYKVSVITQDTEDAVDRKRGAGAGVGC